jgi:uncharacterized membrane protein
MMDPRSHVDRLAPPSSALKVAHVVYALHAISLGIGAWTAASVVGSFLFGWPSLLGVILNYAMRSSAAGTWLESHYDWQIRTFWWAALWAVLIAVVSAPLVLVLVGFATWMIGFALLGLWAMIRISKGWWRLHNSEAVGDDSGR